MTRPCAPVALFAHARPDHLRRTLAALRANPEAAATPLIVFSDGAKSPEQRAAVEQVRALVAGVGGFGSVATVLRERNFGLAASIVGGVTDVLATHGRVIVVEDDILVSPHFLRYMNDALDCYAGAPRVASIHAYCYPTGERLPETFFLRGADCWGWATWSRAWRHFNPDGAALRRALRQCSLERAFDLDGAYPFSRMLDDQIAGRNDSWAVRWHASCFLDDLLTLYPGRSLVHNIGNDASGTHSGATGAFSQEVAVQPVVVRAQPLEASTEALRAFARYLSRERSLLGRLRGWWRGAPKVAA
jgi:hypothetical protein